MQFWTNLFVVTLTLVRPSTSSPVINIDSREELLKGKKLLVEKNEIKRTVFEHEASGATIDYVTNSGICETTPGVNQYSGYVNIANESMWWWFFEARHNPHTAPLALWLNGGPGCSSMEGLFMENGPCQFYNGSSEPSINPYSWNEYANMLYVDEPAEVGFSYGSPDANSTNTAAPWVWKLLQAFLTQFPEYENRDFGLFTESYGGHYGPAFAYYFEAQNAAIARGSITGHPINLIALGINNGWYAADIQEKTGIDFAYANTYRPWLTSAQHDYFLNLYYTECLPLLKICDQTATNADCLNARSICYGNDDNMDANMTQYDWYDLREPAVDPYPPGTYATYLTRPDVLKAIGARSNYSACIDSVDADFVTTADDMRSFLPDLSSVVQSGVQTVIWAGDADAVCDWFGGQASANAIQYRGTQEFNEKTLLNYTVEGVVGGEFKTVDNLSWLRVFESGHMVPYYQPKLALQVFEQALKREKLFST